MDRRPMFRDGDDYRTLRNGKFYSMGNSEATKFEEIDMMYAQKAEIRHRENVVNIGPAFNAQRQKRPGAKSWTCCVVPILFSILIALGIGLVVSGALSDEGRHLPLSGSEPPKRALEFIQIKRIFHYVLPSTPTQEKNDSGNVENLQIAVSSLTARLSAVETTLHAYEETRRSSNEIESEMVALRNRLEKLSQTLDDHVSKQSSQNFHDEVHSLKSDLADVSTTVASFGEEQEKWTRKLNDAILANERIQRNVVVAQLRAQDFVESHCRNCSVDSSRNGLDAESVHGMITAAISTYDADKTGRADYALETAGGSVLGIRCTKTYSASTRRESIFGIPLWYQEYSPRTVIQSGFAPGECWPFEGSHGFLVIKLSSVIKVTGISYEHISKEVSPTGNIDSAPKIFEIYALSSATDEEGLRLGSFEYDSNGPPLQYFPVDTLDSPPTEIVEFRVMSNHGHPVYTCLYRVRVHGERAQPVYGKN